MTGDEAYHADCFRCVECNKKIDDLVFTQTSKASVQDNNDIIVIIIVIIIIVIIIINML
jgi:hypothetical protein